MDVLEKYFIYFLLVFFIPLWITGPAICDILITIGAILGLLNISRIKTLDHKISKFLITYFLVTILFFIITLTNNYNFFHPNSLRYILLAIFDIRFPLFCFFLVSDERVHISRKIKLTSISILSTLIFIFFETYFQLIFKSTLFGFDSPDFLNPNNFNIDRISGPFSDELILGNYLSKLILPCILFLHYLKNKTLRIFSPLFFLLIVFLIFNTGEKSAIINVFLISIITPFLIYQQIPLKYRIFSTAISILILLIVCNLFFPKQFNRYIYSNLTSFGFSELSHNLKIINSSINNDYKDFYEDLSYERHFLNTEHGALVEKSFYMFKENILFGLGRESFRKNCTNLDFTNFKSIYSKYCSTHPHNYILETLNNYGLFGLFLIIICFYLYIYSFKNNYDNNLSISQKNILKGYFVTLLILLFPINLTTSYYINYFQSIFWFILSMSLLHKKVKQ